MLQRRVKLRYGFDSYFQVHDGRIHTIREHKFAVRALDDANFVNDAGIERRNDADHFVEGKISVIPRMHFAEPLFQGFDSGNTTEPPGRTVLLAMAYSELELSFRNNVAVLIAFLTHIEPRTYVSASDAASAPNLGRYRSIAAEDFKSHICFKATIGWSHGAASQRHIIPKLRQSDMSCTSLVLRFHICVYLPTSIMFPNDRPVSKRQLVDLMIPHHRAKGAQPYSRMPAANRRSARQPDDEDQAAPPTPPDARAGLRTRRQATQAAHPTGPPASTTAHTPLSPMHQSMPEPAHRGQSAMPVRSTAAANTGTGPQTRTSTGPPSIPLQSPGSIQSSSATAMALPPLTPARRVADRLAGLLTHQTAMASPGPQMRNPGPETSDTENTSDSDNPPAIRPGQPAGRIPAPSFDSDEDFLPSQPAPTTTSQQPASGAAAPRQRCHAAAVPAGTTDAEGAPTTTSQQPTGGAAAPRQRRRAAALPAGTTDADGYTWTAAEDLLQTDKLLECWRLCEHRSSANRGNRDHSAWSG
ncbi:hypothetical protein B0H13DRAFT_1921463 [Mycena leptocephala]|nr:hypothetical protein B0H13DRAFT_1921463 [Mycena leptocephala]